MLSLVEYRVDIDEIDTKRKDELIEKQKTRSEFPQLIMIFTGFTRAGKNTCVMITQHFCYKICRAVGVAWKDNMFLFTSTRGSAAGLFGGRTIYDVSFLNGREKNIGRKRRDQWQCGRILSFMEI